jgi:phosphatidylglycerophosphatase A
VKTTARVISTWFFCGYAPVGPGTAGSAAALLIAWLLHLYAGIPAMAFAFLGILLAVPGVWAADVTARETGSKDPQFVVVDEVVGQWIAIAGAIRLNWKSGLGAFLLFRLFDIWKPPPVRQLERLPGGVGIVADDAMAGIYAALVLFAAGWFNLY